MQTIHKMYAFEAYRVNGQIYVSPLYEGEDAKELIDYNCSRNTPATLYHFKDKETAEEIHAYWCSQCYNTGNYDDRISEYWQPA